MQKRFHSDIGTIEFLLKIICFMHPKFNFTWVLEDLKDTLKQELDFIHEGQNAERCAKDLAHLKFVHVPEVIWKHSSSVNGYDFLAKCAEIMQLNSREY